MKVKWIVLIAAVLGAGLLAFLLIRRVAPVAEVVSPDVPAPIDALPGLDPAAVGVAACHIEILSPADGSSINPYGPWKLEWSSNPPGSDYYVEFDGPDFSQKGGSPYGVSTNKNVGTYHTTETSDLWYGESMMEGEYAFKVSMQDSSGKWCTAEVHVTKDATWRPEEKKRGDEGGAVCNPVVERCP